jgi:hypothetical protein
MEYHPDEYPSRFCPEPNIRDHPPAWFLAALLIGWFAAMVYAAGTDLEDAVNVAQEEEVAHIKKLELLSTPIYYTATVTQCDTENGCRTRFYSPRSKDE